MDLRSFNWRVIVAVLAATFLVLAGGRYLMRLHTVDRPLARVYGSNPAVRAYQVERGERGLVIKATLARVDNFHDVYLDLKRRTAEVVKKEPFALEVTDRRDANLSDVYYRVHFALEESISRGTFTAAGAAVEREASAAGLDSWKLYVDSDNLYLQLAKGDAYLYEILPRSSAPGGQAASRERGTI